MVKLYLSAVFKLTGGCFALWLLLGGLLVPGFCRLYKAQALQSVWPTLSLRHSGVSELPQLTHSRGSEESILDASYASDMPLICHDCPLFTYSAGADDVWSKTTALLKV